MAIFTVLGAGMMGGALCVPLCDRGHEVRLVGTHLDTAIIDALRAGQEHPTLKFGLPDAIQPYAVEQLADAMDGCEVLALGVSSAGVRWAGRQIAPFARAGLPIFSITKGMDFDGQQLRVLPELLREMLPAELREQVHPAAVAGPCIAGELARRVPSCVVLSGADGQMLEPLAALLRTDFYHVFTSTDVIGVELCAALKNAYAMGVAFGAGLHEQRGGTSGSIAMHNYESAVLAQAIGEMSALVQALGGEAATVAGLAGVGDLDVTNNGGRTGRFGRLLGLGLTVDQAVERMQGATLECLDIIAVMREASRALRERGQLGQDALPLLDHMAEVVLDGAAVDMPFERFFR